MMVKRKNKLQKPRIHQEIIRNKRIKTKEKIVPQWSHQNCEKSHPADRLSSP
jgi:hypothetical protein